MLKPIELEGRESGINMNDNRHRSLRHAQSLRIATESTNDVIVIESHQTVTFHVRRASIATIQHSDYFTRTVIEDIIEDVRG